VGAPPAGALGPALVGAAVGVRRAAAPGALRLTAAAPQRTNSLSADYEG
jgi:hypothetical protein